MTRSFIENMRQVKSGLMRGTDKVDDVMTVDPTPHAGQAVPLARRKTLLRSYSLPQMAGGSASALSLSRCYGADGGRDGTIVT